MGFSRNHQILHVNRYCHTTSKIPEMMFQGAEHIVIQKFSHTTKTGQCTTTLFALINWEGFMRQVETTSFDATGLGLSCGGVRIDFALESGGVSVSVR